eukprot:754744-Hanusia_phi.AAC.1
MVSEELENSTHLCSVCPANTYQDQLGQTACKACPNNTVRGGRDGKRTGRSRGRERKRGRAGLQGRKFVSPPSSNSRLPLSFLLLPPRTHVFPSPPSSSLLDSRSFAQEPSVTRRRWVTSAFRTAEDVLKVKKLRGERRERQAEEGKRGGGRREGKEGDGGRRVKSRTTGEVEKKGEEREE